MKTLQNHYTTSEQSIKLLALGVPLNSADCIRNLQTGMVFFVRDRCGIEGYLEIYKARHNRAGVAWTDGRLKEIWNICGNGAQSVSAKKGTTQIEQLVKLFEENAEYADFSKLEE